MPLQTPVEQSFKRMWCFNKKTLTVICCWLIFFLFGIRFVCYIRLFDDKHTWTNASASFVTSLSCLVALYGIKTTRPSWMLPLLVVTATYTSYFVEVARKSVVAAIENVIFRADESYSFNNNGYWLQLVVNFYVVYACYLYLSTFWGAFKIVRAEKKASESLPLHQTPLHRSFPDNSDKKPILQDV